MGIQFKRSAAINTAPDAAHLAQGELAINTADQLLYTKDQNNKIINIGFSKTYADETFLRLTGGVVKGRLQLTSGTLPSSNAFDDVVSKRYVDSKFGTSADQAPTNTDLSALYVPRSGTIMTGHLSVLTPTAAEHTASKGYTDNTFVRRVGDTITGPITWSGTPTINTHLTTKAYVDNAIENGVSGVNLGSYLLRSGGTMTGAITYSPAPTVDAHLANKGYVDAAVLAGKTNIDTSLFVLKTGGTMTGHLAITSQPTSPSHLSNKAYVDQAITDSQNANLTTVLKAVYPVGCIFVTTMSQNPSTVFGFGSWAQTSQGRVLIGQGTTVDTRGESKTFASGAQGGEFEHQITIDEMPSHVHGITIENTRGSGSDGAEDGNSSFNNGTTQPTGGNQSHNNIQPYLVVYMWKRLA